MSGLEFSLPRPAAGVGRYRYRLNGEPAGVEEHFDVSHSQQDWELSTVRTAPGSTELRAEVSARGSRDATCTLTFSSETVDRVTATYELVGGALSIMMNDGRGIAVLADVLGEAVLSPLLRVFQGPAVSETIRAGGRRPVLIPRLDPGEPETLLTPNVEIRTAEPLGLEAVGDGDAEVLWRHCRYMGGNYDDTAEFWLDERDRLVRYRFPQTSAEVWDVELVS